MESASLAIGSIEWLVLALATYRLVRLLLEDEIMSGLRSLFIEVQERQQADESPLEVVIIKGRGWRYAVGYVLTCHWCAGIWVAAMVVGLYLFASPLYPVLLLLSLAGASSVLHEWISRG
jgi:hypothetical protein